MRVLVTGATGKTGSRVADRLHRRGVEVRAAGRGWTGEGGVRFDWEQPISYESAFAGIDAAYLVAPRGRTDVLATMQPGLEAALAASVRRFVLLSASTLPEGGPLKGEVHAWLRANAADWAVLRPSWFMQNFSEAHHLASIREEGAIYSAAADGRIAFIDAEDIANCAVAALLAPDAANRDHVLTGPQALSYDEVAAILANVAGRPVRHVRLAPEELARHFAHGLPQVYAEALAAMDVDLAAGIEDRTTDTVRDLTGTPPVAFARFAARSANAWRPPLSSARP
jgi:uncharacterized protein YbjT (DUF2867 family)